MPATRASLEPTFNLPTGSASDFYLLREVNDTENANHGKVVKKHGLWRYPYMTRRTGDSLVGTNEEITSSELRHGRTASKTKLGNASSSGSHDFEYSPETFDDQMEGAFRSQWVRWFNDGEKNLITKDYKTAAGYIHVRGDDGTYNQESNGKTVTSVPLFYTENELGTEEDPYGLIKISTDNMGAVTRKAAANPLGKFVVHELHIGDTPVKYSFVSRIPITDEVVRYQDFKHVEVGEMNLNVTVNAIVTGSFSLMGSNNPAYYTENAEKGKTRMADRMGDDEDVAIGATEEFFSKNFKDGAERFLSTLRATTAGTDTDQFTALEGFLFVNGHQLQFASDLTMNLNNNLSPINAIFVKGAIANTSPRLEVSGSITTYFTDGEKDSTGTKFGADDIKNLASQNKDVEIVYAFQDKEDPEVLYLFQIFKATFSAPNESKNADSPITLDMNYNSYGEMAVRCLRLAVPKIRDIEFDVASVLPKIEDGTKEIELTLYPNVPLDPVKEAAYKDTVFEGAEVYVNSEEDADAEFSGVVINADGSISAKLTLSENIAKGDDIQVKVTVNGEDCEKTATVLPEIPYLRKGKNFTSDVTIEEAGDGINVLTEKVGDEDEDYLVFVFDRANNALSADDVVITSSNDDVATITGTTVTPASAGKATIKVASAYDEKVFMTFDVEVTA